MNAQDKSTRAAQTPPIPAEDKLGFVVLRHDVGRKLSRTGQSHLDWMFQQAGDTGNCLLKTWATPILDLTMADPADDHRTGGQLETEATQLIDHRAAYLDFEGEISGGRGRVTRVLSGHYQLLRQATDRWEARLYWSQAGQARCAEVCFYRIRSERRSRREESREGWSLRFSRCWYETN